MASRLNPEQLLLRDIAIAQLAIEGMSLTLACRRFGITTGHIDRRLRTLLELLERREDFTLCPSPPRWREYTTALKLLREKKSVYMPLLKALERETRDMAKENENHAYDSLYRWQNTYESTQDIAEGMLVEFIDSLVAEPRVGIAVESREGSFPWRCAVFCAIDQAPYVQLIHARAIKRWRRVKTMPEGAKGSFQVMIAHLEAQANKEDMSHG